MSKLDTLLTYAPDLWQGFLLTIWLTILTLVISLPFALAVALVRDAKIPVAKTVLAVFVNIFRMLPALLVLFFIFYGAPSLGIRLSPVTAAVIGMTVMAVAYMSEDIRGALQSVDQRQYAACKALGLSYAHTIRRIILPQAIPVLIPPLMTRAIIVMKGTSIASFVSVAELTAQASRATSISFEPFIFLGLAGVGYLLIAGLLAILQFAAERHVRRRYRLKAGY